LFWTSFSGAASKNDLLIYADFSETAGTVTDGFVTEAYSTYVLQYQVSEKMLRTL
jgi:hypothetical protein